MRISEIANVHLGKTPGKSDYRDEGRHKILKYRDLSDTGEIVWTNADKGFVENSRAKTLNLRVIQSGDVLISASAHSSEIIGRKVLHVRTLPEEFESIYFVGEILCIRLRHPQAAPHLSRLLKYFFRSINGYRSIQAKVHGVHLIASRAEEITLPIPPLREQQRIVSRIEELLSRIEEGERALERVQKLVRHGGQSVLKAAVTGELTSKWRKKRRGKLESGSALLQRILKARRSAWEKAELDKMKVKGRKPVKNENWKQRYREPLPPDNAISLPDLPPGWTTAGIEQLIAFDKDAMKTGPFGSLLKKREHVSHGIPVLGIENVKALQFVPGSKIHITPEKASQLDGYRVVGGDVVISRSGTVGEVCVVPDEVGEARISTNLMKISLAPDGLLPELLAFQLYGSPTILRQIEELCKGSTRNFLNQTILAKLVFAVPPLEEQRKILDLVITYRSTIEQLGQQLDAEFTRSEALRQSVLKTAFAGALVEQDSTDEPVSVLLERISTATGVARAVVKRRRQEQKAA